MRQTMLRPYQPGLRQAEASAVLCAQAAQGLHEPRLVAPFQRLWEAGALRGGPPRPAGSGGPPEGEDVASA